MGRLETDEQPIRIDRPEATFETGQADGAISPPLEKGRFKEDYRRTSRGGQKVYAHVRNDADVISQDAYRALPNASSQAAEKSAEPGRGGQAKERRFFKGATISEDEARELHEPLREAIKQEFHVADQALWLRCPQLDERDIWGNVDDDETEALASLLLKRAERSPAAATVVRGMIDASDYLVVGAMFAPRIQQTVQALRETPKRDQPMVNISLFRGRGKQKAGQP